MKNLARVVLPGAGLGKALDGSTLEQERFTVRVFEQAREFGWLRAGNQLGLDVEPINKA